MRVIRRVFIFCGVVLVSVTAYAQSSKTDPARGAAKAAACGACHGSPKTAPLAGMPSLAGQQSEFLANQLFLLREGLRDVPQMAGMLKGWSNADLNDVAAYFSAQALPQGNSSRDPGLHARGAALSKAMGCGSCHMGAYQGQRQIPRITNQREDYLAASLKAYRDNKRTGIDTSMNAAMYRVTDEEIRALAHYLAHQK